MCPWKFKKIPHPKLEISINLSDFSKEVWQLPDWETYKKSELFGTSAPTSQECFQKFQGDNPRNVSIRIQKDISSRAGYIPKFVGSMPTTRLTDIQENQNYLELVYQHLRNVSKNPRKISHPEPEISLCLILVRKQANKQTDRHTWNWLAEGWSLILAKTRPGQTPPETSYILSWTEKISAFIFILGWLKPQHMFV